MSDDSIDFEQFLWFFTCILGIVNEIQKPADAFKSYQGNDSQKWAWLPADFVSTVSDWASVQSP
jgi:hypothetical protein